MARFQESFVTLVTDGKAIDGFGQRCRACGQPTDASDGRKDQFLAQGRALLRDLASLLSLDPKLVRTSSGGSRRLRRRRPRRARAVDLDLAPSPTKPVRRCPRPHSAGESPKS